MSFTSDEVSYKNSTQKIEHAGSESSRASSTSPAMSYRSSVAVARSSEDDAPEVEISAGQKMLSAVSGSLLTSLIGMLPAYSFEKRLIIYSYPP